MMPGGASRWTWQPCAIAALAIAVAAGVRLVLLDDFGRSTPYVTFYPALMIAAMVGGLRTGLLSTAAIAGLVFFWIQGATIAPSEGAAWVVFLLSGVLVSTMGEVMRRNRAKLEQAEAAATQQAGALRAANETLQRQEGERAREAAESHRSEEMMELALTTADITAFTQDRSLRYTWLFNPQLTFTVAGVIGRSDAELLPAADLGPLEAVKRRVLDHGESIREEVRITASGHPRYFLLHAKPLRDAAGAITGLSGLTVDITERKVAEEQARAAQAETALLLAEGRISRLALLSVVEDQRKAQEALRESEESLRQLNLELEQRVQERTAELEAAIQELEAFNYSVSHDLRAPLRAIDGFARILQEDFAAQLGDEGRRVLGIIVKEEQRMEALVNDLLRLSRLGRQALDRHAVDMHELATLVAEPMLAEAGGRVVRLEVADLPTAWADASLIRQVLTNLLDNAFKFTKRRPVAEITVGGSQQEGETVYFVADNGVGFEMSRIDRLFGVFQRLHSDEVYNGTGVGLALVRRIVLRHGGRVWAESRVGEGAKFYFALPVALTPLPKPVSLRSSASPFPSSVARKPAASAE